jgi:hypothetical protein
MASAFVAMVPVVNFGPRALLDTFLGPQVDGVAQGFVTGESVGDGCGIYPNGA